MREGHGKREDVQLERMGAGAVVYMGGEVQRMAGLGWKRNNGPSLTEEGVTSKLEADRDEI